MRVPVVGGLAYIERVRQVPDAFEGTLVVEPENRYFRHAIAVIVNGGKVGYVAPEVAVDIYDRVRDTATPITCSGRRALPSDHAGSGVELLLDPSGMPAKAGS